MERICEKRRLGNKERKTTSKFMFVLVFLLLLSLGIAFIGITSAKTIHVPDDYPTIQQAVDDATDGDTVIVHRYSGIYGAKWKYRYCSIPRQ
jgi:endonuclease YncB( thermonuclease family)